MESHGQQQLPCDKADCYQGHSMVQESDNINHPLITSQGERETEFKPRLLLTRKYAQTSNGNVPCSLLSFPPSPSIQERQKNKIKVPLADACKACHYSIPIWDRYDTALCNWKRGHLSLLMSLYQFLFKKIATFFIKRVIRRHSGTFTLRTFRRER